MYDLVLKGGRIYDGSGMPSFNGDLPSQTERSLTMGRLNGSARRTLNVDGLAVRARLHRSAYASGCAIVLGSAGHIVLFSRRYFGGSR